MPKSISASLRMILQKIGPVKLMKRDFTRDDIVGIGDELSKEGRPNRSWGVQGHPDVNLKASKLDQRPTGAGPKKKDYSA
jgi:hypothetical protein